MSEEVNPFAQYVAASPEPVPTTTPEENPFAQYVTQAGAYKQALIDKIQSGATDYTYGPGSPGATPSDMRQKTGARDNPLSTGDIALPQQDYELFTPQEREQLGIADTSWIKPGHPTPRGSVERYFGAETSGNPFAQYVSSQEIPGRYGAVAATPSETPSPVPPPTPAVPLDVGLAVAPEEFPQAIPEPLTEPDKSYMDLLAVNQKPLLNINQDDVKLALQIYAPNVSRAFGVNPLAQNAYDGLTQSAASTLSGMTSGPNLVMIGGMALVPEIAGAQFIGRAASLGFTAAQASALWQELPSLKEDPGSPEWWKHFGNVAFNAATLPLGVMGIFRRKTVPQQPSGIRQPPTQAGAITTIQGLENSIHGVTDSTIMPSVPPLPAQPPATQYQGQYTKGLFGFLPAGRCLSKTNFKRWLGNWDASRQIADGAVMDLSKNLVRAVPDKNRRVAIYNWAAAAGDDALLRNWEGRAPQDVKRGYQDALTLTQHEKNIGLKVREGYDQWLSRGQDLGMLQDGVTDYMRRIVTKRPEIAEEAMRGAFASGGGLSQNFAAARERFWQTMVDAEREGVRYDKDLGVTTASYARSLTRAAINRTAVRQLFDLNTESGRPMVMAQGMGIPVGSTGNTALLVQPFGVKRFPGQQALASKLKANHPTWSDAKAMAVARDKISQEYIGPGEQIPGNGKMPYIRALDNWQWVESLGDGTNIMVRGHAKVHKSVAMAMAKKFGTERVDWLDKYFLQYQGKVKSSKLSGTAFHQVHEYVNAFGHEINFKNIRPLNELAENPNIRYGMQNGLQMFSSRTDAALMGEAMAGQAWVEQVPGVGKWMANYKSWLFEDHIPRLKGEMYLKALDRNRRRYPALNEEQLSTLTARQSNATFGEQNYRQMVGRLTGDPRFWQGLQTIFLAPDFGASKLQHITQAFTPYGGEQRMALANVAATLWTSARIMNQLTDGDPHFEPENAFAVIAGDRKITIRSLPGDMQHLWSDPSSYTSHRLSPGSNLAIETMVKRDYQGRPIGYSDIAKDILLSPVPIVAQRAVENVLPWGKQNRYDMRDMLASTIGLSTSIYRDENEIRKLAVDWKKQSPDLAADIEAQQGYVNPPSKYNDLRNALANDDLKTAKAEYENLLAEGGHLTEKFLRDNMKKWMHAPFATGSKAREREFIDTLTQRQQELYEKARTEREKVYDNFRLLTGGG